MVACLNVYAYSLASDEPPTHLLRLEEEALAALPGGTGPGALDGASGKRRTGASRERRLRAPRPRHQQVVTAAFRLPSEPNEVPPASEDHAHADDDPGQRPPGLGGRRGLVGSRRTGPDVWTAADGPPRSRGLPPRRPRR